MFQDLLFSRQYKAKDPFSLKRLLQRVKQTVKQIKEVAVLKQLKTVLYDCIKKELQSEV